MECEILQTILTEARESYDEEIVVPLANNTLDQMQENKARVHAWISAWRANNQPSE
jgi:adenylate kinase